MYLGRTTLSKFLIQQLTGIPGANDLGALLIDVAAAIKAISAMTAKGALGGYLGEQGGKNAQGETQQKLDVLAHEVMIRSCEWGGLLAGMVSEELEDPCAVPEEYVRGRYLLAFDPLDGSSNIDVNVAVGTIFSVLRHDSLAPPGAADYLQPGCRQVAAGYAIYGPATMLVITVGKGTHGFTLDREIGNFILTHPDLEIPPDSSEFAINTSNARFWEPPVHRYVSECQAGKSGIRCRDFNMRWIASLVAEVHRILMRGGVFMYPKDTRDASRPGVGSRKPDMSVKHPIIAVTGSSGAGTTTVMQSFAHIFRREGIKAQVIEGDSLHRYSRVEMRERVQAAERGAGSPISHFGPGGHLLR